MKVENWKLEKESGPVFLEFTLSGRYVAPNLRQARLSYTCTNPLCCVTRHGVGSDSLWPNEWMFPQCPATALLSSCRLRPMASFMESAHLLFGLPLFLLTPSHPCCYSWGWKTKSFRLKYASSVETASPSVKWKVILQGWKKSQTLQWFVALLGPQYIHR